MASNPFRILEKCSFVQTLKSWIAPEESFALHNIFYTDEQYIFTWLRGRGPSWLSSRGRRQFFPANTLKDNFKSLGSKTFVPNYKSMLCWNLSSADFAASHPYGMRSCGIKIRLRDVWYKKTGTSYFFCNLTKWFLACQNHSQVLKHVLQ